MGLRNVLRVCGQAQRSRRVPFHLQPPRDPERFANPPAHLGRSSGGGSTPRFRLLRPEATSVRRGCPYSRARFSGCTMNSHSGDLLCYCHECSYVRGLLQDFVSAVPIELHAGMSCTPSSQVDVWRLCVRSLISRYQRTPQQCTALCVVCSSGANAPFASACLE